MKITGNAYKLILEKKKKKRGRKIPLTQEQIDLQTKKWTTFYRRNWNIYATEELEIPLYFFQQILLYLIGISEIFYEMCTRGLTKSFIAATAGVVQCMLYPNSEVVLTSATMKTATKLVKNKIESEIFGKMSKKLKYLKDNKLIKFTYNKEDIRVDFVFNNSWILVLPERDSSLGERSNFLIFEETRLLQEYSVDSIFMPMSRARQAEYLLLPKYTDKNGKPLKELIEPCKKIYLTSTKYKYMWFWKRWVSVVKKTFNPDGIVRYNFFCGDIFTALFHGIKTEQDFQEYTDNMSEIELRMEIYNEPQGEVEGAYYGLQQFTDNAILELAFEPPSYEDYVCKYEKGNIEFFREKKDSEIRVIYVDFAFADTVKKSQENDNTVIGCMSGFNNETMDKILRNCEYMETYSGGKKDESILRIRELFYFYKADVLILDLRNGGEDRYIDLTKPFHHEQLGINMNGFGIYNDSEILSFFCESAKIENLKSRVVDKNAIPVTIPVIGSDERNNNYHIKMKDSLDKKIIRFLIDELKAKEMFEEDDDFMFMDSNKKALKMLPYIQTSKMIEEAIKLEQEIKNGYIKLKEPPHGATKDRIICTEYANYFYHLLELKLAKKGNNNELDMDAFADIYDL